MKEKIYTIPVNDAFANPAVCPLCSLEDNLNESLLEYYLGPSLMESDVRQTTNKDGFCREHLNQLYKKEMNRLGLGLMLHTHLLDLQSELYPLFDQCSQLEKKGLFSGRKNDYRQILNEAAAQLEKRTGSCVICSRIQQTKDRYLDVIFHEYVHNPQFRQQFLLVQGFCLPHLAVLLKGAARHLNQRQAEAFIKDLVSLEKNNVQVLCDDVEWFTLKFDHKNHGKDWKNSKDALPRCISRLRGGSRPDGR